jgi:hypothetical protein
MFEKGVYHVFCNSGADNLWYIFQQQEMSYIALKIYWRISSKCHRTIPNTAGNHVDSRILLLGSKLSYRLLQRRRKCATLRKTLHRQIWCSLPPDRKQVRPVSMVTETGPVAVLVPLKNGCCNIRVLKSNILVYGDVLFLSIKINNYVYK